MEGVGGFTVRPVAIGRHVSDMDKADKDGSITMHLKEHHHDYALVGDISRQQRDPHSIERASTKAPGRHVDELWNSAVKSAPDLTKVVHILL